MLVCSGSMLRCLPGFLQKFLQAVCMSGGALGLLDEKVKAIRLLYTTLKVCNMLSVL